MAGREADGRQPEQVRDSHWAKEAVVRRLRRGAYSIWNLDYLDTFVLPRLAIPKGGVALDAGCGQGMLTLHIASRRPDIHVTGVDFEPSNVAGAEAQAAARGLRNVRFQEADAHRLPFPASTFDAVLCSRLLINVTDAAACVREMARVLKPGGVFFAAEYHATGMASEFTNATPGREADDWRLELVRLNRLHAAGSRARGEGDVRLGVRLPLMAREAGLNVFDVRLNDRVYYAMPPYGDEQQQAVLDDWRWWATHSPEAEDRAKAWQAILAGGGTEADAERYLAMWHDPLEKQLVLDAIEAGQFCCFGAFLLYLTFARKPS
jgi:ubiquinone/menaquinone biosynthesis C-methylase UbiE